MPPSVTVRPATVADIDAVRDIYAHYVHTSVATFELEPPSREELLARLGAVRATGLPYLVAAVDGRITGYAYCAPWKSRPAYRYTVEDSVYIAPDAVGMGIGGRLLDSLLKECAAAGVREVIAVIVDADANGSLTLHRRRGFVEAGRLERVGFKHGRWLDTVLLQKSLA